MEKAFDSVSFVAALSNELIAGFEKAGKATTPATVGAAREHAVREKLEKILPGQVGIGSGFVFDSYGHTSKQTDIIIYEKGICPVFSIEGTPETTYYSCEGVIAIGEIKSTLDTDGIIDSFSKVESVKKNRRYVKDLSIGESIFPRWLLMERRKNDIARLTNHLIKYMGLFCANLSD